LNLQAPLAVAWVGEVDGLLRLIDQTLLPQRLEYVDCSSPEMVWEAIRQLRVRGAPAIGIAAAYGVCLAGETLARVAPHARPAQLQTVIDYLASSRPTAVNLFWALDRMRRRASAVPATASLQQFREQLLDEARRIQAEDSQSCRAIGRSGAPLLADGCGVLTHCNAGGLATAEYGTALSIIFTAQEQGKRLHVYVDETRPLLQGARLTAWELQQRNVPSTLICDSAAAQVMQEGRVSAVIVGADRIAANGDTANKIGTYALALLAQAHSIPFYVAAPLSTFDLTLETGASIPIEQRAAEEITCGFGRQTAPRGVEAYNPAFDVTPARYISAIVTERGIIRPVTAQEIRRTSSALQA
jgi:methylthioribose-1-phosphate isomerase